MEIPMGGIAQTPDCGACTPDRNATVTSICETQPECTTYLVYDVKRSEIVGYGELLALIDNLVCTARGAAGSCRFEPNTIVELQRVFCDIRIVDSGDKEYRLKVIG